MNNIYKNFKHYSNWTLNIRNMSGQLCLKYLKRDLFGSHLPPSVLSPISYSNLVFSINWASFWGGIPYEFDSKKWILVVTKSSLRRWAIVLTFYIIQFCFSFTRLITKYHEMTLFDIALSFQLGLILLLIMSLSINVGWRMNEYAWCINSAMEYLRKIRERSTNKLSKKWNNGCEELMIAQRVALTLLPFFITIHYLQRSQKPVYATSLMSPENPVYPLLYIMVGIFQFIEEMAGSSSIMCNSFIGMGLIFTLISLTNEMRPGRAIYRTKPSFRKPEELRKTIRSFQLLAIYLNISWRGIVMFIQTVITYSCTICIFISIRFWNFLGVSNKAMLVTSAMVMVVTWSTILTMAVLTYTQTEAALNSWRNFNFSPLDKKLMKKFRKSVRPIQLEFSGFYYVRPKKILGFWNTLIWLVVRALLTVEDSSHHHIN